MDKKEILSEQIKEERSALLNNLNLLKETASLSAEESNDLLKKTEKLYKSLLILQFLSKNHSLDSDFNVHVKIMQASEIKKEVVNEIKENSAPEITIESIKPVEEELEPRGLKKMEIGINDRYRFINELFQHNNAEFNAAVQQINSTTSWEETQQYLQSILLLYQWKEDSILVKSFFAAAKKRFL